MTDNQNKYQQQHRDLLGDPSKNWLRAAADVHWFKPPMQGVDTSRSPFNRWFSGGQMNASYNALDHQVAQGRGEHKTLIHDSPMTGTRKIVTNLPISSDFPDSTKPKMLAMRSIADSTDWKMPATVDDPAILDEITQSLRTLGFAQNKK